MDFMSIIIYKPDRILYYIEPTDSELMDFDKGIMPASLMKYDGAFGTYDNPGLFLIKENNDWKKVLGIEYRPDDDRVDYPEGLETVRLPKGFMVSSNITEDNILSDEVVLAYVDQITQYSKGIEFHQGQVLIKDPLDLIQIFTLNGHKRILIAAEYFSETPFLEAISKNAEESNELFATAYRDHITGHYNWGHIWPIISGYGMMGIQDFSFVHFDVKDYKSVNVVYGHEVANKLLRKIVNHMNETDWIYHSARCDNDNFAMMIKDMPQQETWGKLIRFFEDISHLDEDENYHIYYRCGVVPMRNTLLLGDIVADAGKHVQRMGVKLYETEVLFYTEQMHDEREWSIRTRSYLDTAIEQDEFLIHLQPKYNINTEKIEGAEALIRWKFQGRELLSPWRFIPIFETGGLINKLDDIVLIKVCECLKRWEKEKLPLYPISVNLSRKSMGIEGLVEHLTAIVDSYQIDHALIDFELTESAAYDNQEYMISIIKQLKAKGFKISMDDFGTGYSSLSLLPKMPFDTLKIDKSFVDGLDNSENSKKECSIVKHIIAMAKDFDMICLAEGAEEKEQVDILREFGCEEVQGYYYSKPVPVDEYEKKLKDMSDS